MWVSTANLRLPGQLTRKLAPKWIGPYQVVQVVNPVAYKVELPESYRIHPVFHVSMLKPNVGERS